MKVWNYYKTLSSKERAGVITGFMKAVLDRQQRYISLTTPVLLAGLYGKEKVIHFIQTYWYIIPLWIMFVFFDIFVLLPGEQLFYAKSNKILMEMHSDLKNGKKDN